MVDRSCTDTRCWGVGVDWGIWESGANGQSQGKNLLSRAARHCIADRSYKTILTLVFVRSTIYVNNIFYVGGFVMEFRYPTASAEANMNAMKYLTQKSERT